MNMNRNAFQDDIKGIIPSIAALCIYILFGFCSISVTTLAEAGSLNIAGRVSSANGSPVCAMVLANGVSTFSCDGAGNFSLNGILTDASGKITLFSWSDGSNPYKIIFTPSSSNERRDITMTQSPCKGTGGDLGGYSSGVQQINLSGRAYLQGTNTPVCALVLANGKSMFSCDSGGNFSLMGVQVDGSGKITMFAWADGFLPYKLVFKPSSSQEQHDIDMKVAQGCSSSSSYVLTLNMAGTGSGAVSGGGIYKAGDWVYLSATPASDSTFAGWSPYPCAASFTMPAQNLTCTATFNQTPQPTYTVTLATAGSGKGTVSGGGSYKAGDQVNLTANSSYCNPPSDFDGWSPWPCANQFIMPTRDLVCTATFITVTRLACNHPVIGLPPGFVW